MKKFDTINVIPFIDIMLVLLAIVLTTATFVSNGQLDIDLPSSSATAAPENIERVEIAVDREGILFIDGIENSLEQAESQLQVLPKDSPILLLMDETVEFRQFVEVIDILKRFSLDKVSVLTRKDN